METTVDKVSTPIWLVMNLLINRMCYLIFVIATFVSMCLSDMKISMILLANGL